MGWTIFGIGVEAFGILNLFGDFFPVVLTFLRNMPVSCGVPVFPPPLLFCPWPFHLNLTTVAGHWFLFIRPCCSCVHGPFCVKISLARLRGRKVPLEILSSLSRSFILESFKNPRVFHECFDSQSRRPPAVKPAASWPPRTFPTYRNTGKSTCPEKYTPTGGTALPTPPSIRICRYNSPTQTLRTRTVTIAEPSY